MRAKFPELKILLGSHLLPELRIVLSGGPIVGLELARCRVPTVGDTAATIIVRVSMWNCSSSTE